MLLKVLSYNISGHNVSKGGHPGLTPSLTLQQKHELVAQEALRHDPDVIALQVHAGSGISRTVA